jgi:hypothetical protein
MVLGVMNLLSDDQNDRYVKNYKNSPVEMQDFCDDIMTNAKNTDEYQSEMYKRAIYCSLAVLSILGLTIVSLSIFLQQETK